MMCFCTAIISSNTLYLQVATANEVADAADAELSAVDAVSSKQLLLIKFFF
jgi:hypothetical protein